MANADFNRWARGFRAAAAADNYRLAVDGWERGCVSFTNERDPIQKWRARELVRDTIQLTALVLAFYEMDRSDAAARFLRLQTYDPAQSEGRYLLLFELGRYRRTQLLVDELQQVDLADLQDALGFELLLVRRRDEREFEPGEHAALREAIRYDVYHDQGEDEMRLEFDEASNSLLVDFHDPTIALWRAAHPPPAPHT